MKQFLKCFLVVLTSIPVYYFGVALEGKYPWLLNHPPEFHGSTSLGRLLDVRSDSKNMTFYKEFIEVFLSRVDGFTDGTEHDSQLYYTLLNGQTLNKITSQEK